MLKREKESIPVLPIVIVAHPNRIKMAEILSEDVAAEAVCVDTYSKGCLYNHIQALTWLKDCDAAAEEWRSVLGYEGLYEASDRGRVRSLSRTSRSGGGNGLHFYPGKILRQWTTKGGYLVVRLSKDGHRKRLGVHEIVMFAFEGPKPEGLWVCHNNGNPADNRRCNLRYDTPSANALDSVRHGTCFHANKNKCPAGHPYDEKNTRLVNTPSGSGVGRQCRLCDKERAQMKRSRNRDAYNADARRRRAAKRIQ